MKHFKKVLLLTPTHMEMQCVGLSLQDSGQDVGHGFECAVCGFGPVSTAVFLAQRFSRSDYDMILLMGLAGAYSGSQVQVGDICVAESEVYADLGRCVGNVIEPIEIVEETTSLRFDLLTYWNASLFGCIEDVVVETGAKMVDMATVCCVSCNQERAMSIAMRWGVAAENMEGAAAAQVCAVYGIPFLEVRAVSNWAGDCDKTRWRIQPALARLRDFILCFIRRLNAV
ncbi:MAG: futalosine hydrolase [Dissulfuribacterales bacterium]